MTAIALSWVATIKVGNQTAKQLLQFYASHNFNKPGFEFKNETLANQLEVKVRAIQNAHKLLIDKGFLKKEERFAKDGSQLSSTYYLNIPNEFVDNFFNKGGEGVLKTSPPCLKDTPRGVLKTPLNNNINNKNNRESALSDFSPNEENVSLCKEFNLSLEEELSSFKNRHKGKKSQYEFERWLKNAKQYKDRNKSNQNNEIRSSVPEYGPGHPRWESLHGKNNIMNKGNSHGSEISSNYTGRNGVRKAQEYLF